MTSLVSGEMSAVELLSPIDSVVVGRGRLLSGSEVKVVEFNDNESCFG